MSKTRTAVYHNLSLMLDAGLPILKALNTAGKGMRGKVARSMPKIAEEVSQGMGLAEAMGIHGKLFDPLDLRLIEAGERSGDLSDVFELLSQWYAFRHRLGRTILSGMLLPILLITLTAFLAPLPSVILGGGGFNSYVIQATKILAVFYVPVMIILAVVFLTPKRGTARKILDEAILWIPILRKAVNAASMSRYCRCFVMLYTAGVPIIECAELATQSVSNLVISGWLSGGAESGRAGNSIVEGFSQRLDFEFLNAWAVGEESGELDNAVERMGEYYTFRAEFLFGEIAKWLPRIAYAFVCIIMIIKIFEGYSQILGGRGVSF